MNNTSKFSAVTFLVFAGACAGGAPDSAESSAVVTPSVNSQALASDGSADQIKRYVLVALGQLPENEGGGGEANRDGGYQCGLRAWGRCPSYTVHCAGQKITSIEIEWSKSRRQEGCVSRFGEPISGKLTLARMPEKARSWTATFERLSHGETTVNGVAAIEYVERDVRSVTLQAMALQSHIQGESTNPSCQPDPGDCTYYKAWNLNAAASVSTAPNQPLTVDVNRSQRQFTIGGSVLVSGSASGSLTARWYTQLGNPREMTWPLDASFTDFPVALVAITYPFIPECTCPVSGMVVTESLVACDEMQTSFVHPGGDAKCAVATVTYSKSRGDTDAARTCRRKAEVMTAAVNSMCKPVTE